MEGRIGHLHHRYRVLDRSGAAALLAAQLDRHLSARLPDAVQRALDEALGDDPTVYVLRRVATKLTVRGRVTNIGPTLAQEWGDRLAGAIVRHIAADEDNGGNLVCFADQAEFVARFLADLLADRAWGCWYYGAFASLRGCRTGEVLARVLHDNAACLPQVVSRLHRSGFLDRLLSLLEPDEVRRLWRGDHASDAEARRALYRPLLLQVLRLIQRVGWWRPSGEEVENLLTAYGATCPEIPDWSDRSALTRAFVDIVRFVVCRARPSPVSWQTTESTRGWPELDEILAGVDWLDAGVLRAELEQLRLPQLSNDELPLTRPRTDATPRQRQFLAALQAVIADRDVAIDARDCREANALRLLAAVVARDVQWATDVSAARLIDVVLATWERLRSAPDAEALRRLHGDDFAGALRLLSEREPESLAALTALGVSGMTVVQRLLSREQPTADLVDRSVDSQCAGVFLIARAVADARLSTVLRESSCPIEVRTLLAALVLQWSGGAGCSDDRLDPAVAAFADAPRLQTIASLRDGWAGVVDDDLMRLQAGVLQMLVEQRLIGGQNLDVLDIESGSSDAAAKFLLAGDAHVPAWAFAASFSDQEERQHRVRDWMRTWKNVTGLDPVVVADDPSIEAQRVALRYSFETLAPGNLGLPAVDLTVSVVAMALLRIWGRWLRQFAESSLPYLLEQFIRRPGRLTVDDDTIIVDLERRPLDIVLEMAGYTADLERLSWLSGRRLCFRFGGG
ncbi:MAG: hypothetical protein HY270_18395 [Deltaproteobacteria bacterium]|nr:hypothetical protein [Deltaproteobacteria bacterium]